MNEFLNSLKADLLDPRLRLLLGALVAALIAALAYVALGGGGSAATPPAAPLPATSAPSGLPVSAAPGNPYQGVAEVTSGASKQHRGLARDPFATISGLTTTPPASSKGSASSAARTSKVASGSSGSATSAPTSGSGAPASSTPAPATEPAKPTKPAKPKPKYVVDVALGQVPAGTPPLSAPLTPYEDVKPAQKLPSAQQTLVSFAGAGKGGKSASFKLESEAILRGPAQCKPSTTQCEAIVLTPGQSEELEYMPPGLVPEVWLLKVVSITPAKKASAARAHRAHAATASVALNGVASGAEAPAVSPFDTVVAASLDG